MGESFLKGDGQMIDVSKVTDAQRERIAYWEAQGFKVTRVFVDEYVFMYHMRTLMKVRIYEDGRIVGPYE